MRQGHAAPRGGEWGPIAVVCGGKKGPDRGTDPGVAVAGGVPCENRGGGPVQMGRCAVVGRLPTDVGRSGKNGKWARPKKHNVVFIIIQILSKRIELI
jgi:hypothetical protein